MQNFVKIDQLQFTSSCSCDSHPRRSSMSVTLLVFLYLLVKNRADLLWTISIWCFGHVGVYSRFTAVVQAGLYHGEVSLCLGFFARLSQVASQET